MAPAAKPLKPHPDKPSSATSALPSAVQTDPRDDRERSLVELLGEVIRMSQAWVRALESGDPFTAEKYEAKCILAMEQFEWNRQKTQAKVESFEQTR